VMKALTVRQPWASAIIWAGKTVENRSWWRWPSRCHAEAPSGYGRHLESSMRRHGKTERLQVRPKPT
jgi:hypothetical protein